MQMPPRQQEREPEEPQDELRQEGEEAPAEMPEEDRQRLGRRSNEEARDRIVRANSDQIDTAKKRAQALIDQFQKEKREQLIVEGRRKYGLIGGWFKTEKIREEVDKKNNEGLAVWHVTKEEREFLEDLMLQEITGQVRSASTAEAYRLLENLSNGGLGTNRNEARELMPAHNDFAWWGRGMRIDNAYPSGLTGAMGLGVSSVIGRAFGVATGGGAVGAIAGGLTGGLFGYLRGRRDAAEVMQSGESWIRELEAALKTREVGPIEGVCHKIEMIFNDPAARHEFFQNRPRLEALRVLRLYQEAMRRLGMIRMANEIARAAPEAGSEKDVQSRAAEIYTRFNQEMAATDERGNTVINEEWFGALYAGYGQAIDRERRVVGVGEGVEAPIGDEEQMAREETEAMWIETARNRRREARWRIAQHMIQSSILQAATGSAGALAGLSLMSLFPGGIFLAGAVTGLAALGSLAIDRRFRKHFEGISKNIMNRWGQEYLPNTGDYGDIVEISKSTAEREVAERQRRAREGQAARARRQAQREAAQGQGGNQGRGQRRGNAGNQDRGDRRGQGGNNQPDNGDNDAGAPDDDVYYE